MTAPMVNTTYLFHPFKQNIQGRDQWRYQSLFHRLRIPYQHRSSPLWTCRSLSRHNKTAWRWLQWSACDPLFMAIRPKQTRRMVPSPTPTIPRDRGSNKMPAPTDETSRTTRLFHTNNGVDEVEDGSIQGRFIRLHQFTWTKDKFSNLSSLSWREAIISRVCWINTLFSNSLRTKQLIHHKQIKIGETCSLLEHWTFLNTIMSNEIHHDIHGRQKKNGVIVCAKWLVKKQEKWMTHILNEVLFPKMNLLERIHHSKNRKKGNSKREELFKNEDTGLFCSVGFEQWTPLLRF